MEWEVARKCAQTSQSTKTTCSKNLLQYWDLSWTSYRPKQWTKKIAKTFFSFVFHPIVRFYCIWGKCHIDNGLGYCCSVQHCTKFRFFMAWIENLSFLLRFYELAIEDAKKGERKDCTYTVRVKGKRIFNLYLYYIIPKGFPSVCCFLLLRFFYLLRSLWKFIYFIRIVRILRIFSLNPFFFPRSLSTLFLRAWMCIIQQFCVNPLKYFHAIKLPFIFEHFFGLFNILFGPSF